MSVLGRIEKHLNRILVLDEDALRGLADLSGQVILLELINTDLTIYILPSAHGISLLSQYQGNTNVKIRGTPSDMVAYLLKSSERSSGFSGSIEVIGDVGLAQEFQSIVLNLDLDWEEQLAKWFGDALAHQMGRFLSGGAGFARNTGDRLQQDVSEYLRFEHELTLDKTEMTDFGSKVDTLRNDVERLKLRIMRLEQHIEEKVKQC